MTYENQHRTRKNELNIKRGSVSQLANDLKKYLYPFVLGIILLYDCNSELLSIFVHD